MKNGKKKEKTIKSRKSLYYKEIGPPPLKILVYIEICQNSPKTLKNDPKWPFFTPTCSLSCSDTKLLLKKPVFRSQIPHFCRIFPSKKLSLKKVLDGVRKILESVRW
jgi:hypothetical protein